MTPHRRGRVGRLSFLLASVFLVLALASCQRSAGEGGGVLPNICETDEDCPGDLRCAVGICVGSSQASSRVDLVFAPVGRSDLGVQAVRSVEVPESGVLNAYQLQEAVPVQGVVLLVDAEGERIANQTARAVVEFRPRFAIPGRIGSVTASTVGEGTFPGASAQGLFLTPGTYDVLVSADIGAGSATTVFPDRRVTPESDFTFEVPGTVARQRVSGRVVVNRASVQPLVGATVTAQFGALAFAEATTNENGDFLLFLPPDATSLNLAVRSPLQDGESFHVEFAEAPIPEDGEDLTLRIPGGELRSLTYSILNEFNAILFDAQVYARSEIERTESLPNQPGVVSGTRDAISSPDRTTGDGVLVAPIGEVVVNIAPLDGVHGIAVQPSFDMEETNVRRGFRVPSRALIQTSLTEPDGAPANGASVEARLAELPAFNGNVLVPLSLFGGTAFSDADGAVAIELQPGRYDVRFTPASTLDGLAITRAEWSVGADGAVNGDAVLSFGQAVIGRVLDPEGNGLPGAQVEAWNTLLDPDSPLAIATSDATGNFRLLLPVSEGN